MKMRFRLLILFLSVFSLCHADPDFALMRRNLRERITLGALDYDASEPHMRGYLDSLVAEAGQYQRSMRRDTAWLWDDISCLTGVPEKTPFHVHKSYTRLHTMARAWAYPGTVCYHDAALLADIRFGLALLYRIAYNENTPMCGNWWEWRIGNTWDYANIVSILYDELSPLELRQFDLGGSRHVRDFVRHGNMTYANLADICLNLLLIGILTDNADDIQTAVECCVPAFVDRTTRKQRVIANAAHDTIIRTQTKYRHNTIVWEKEGLYEDGTFIQHIAIPYIGTYGLSMVNLLADMVKIFDGTDYVVPQQVVDVLPIWVTKTYLPSMYKGEIMLMFMGRGNARNPYRNARQCALNILECAPLIADSLTRRRVVHVCAGMIAGDRHFASVYDDMPPLPVNKPRIDAALALADGNTAEDEFSIVLAAGDRLIHQTPRFRFGLAMSSNRIGKYEASIRLHKSENTTGWYTGDGMTYIYLPDDPGQYWQYVPHINPYRVPGTTVDMLQREPCASGMILFDSRPEAVDIARAGGVMMDGLYSSAMMRLLGSRSELTAKKSWFCFGSEVVCLGAGINLGEYREVITTIENRQHAGRLVVDGRQVYAADSNLSATIALPFHSSRVRYAWLEGTGGYLLPKPAPLYANMSDRGCTELWLSHGVAPEDGRYAYLLLPAMSLAETQRYVRKPDVRILRNDGTIQAVRDRKSGITAINFWAAGKAEGVSADGVAALMMRRDGRDVRVSVSDPTWDRSVQTFVFDGRYSLKETSEPQNITVRIDGGRTVVTVNASLSLGMTRTFVLTRL